jgi:hypothetical protein
MNKITSIANTTGNCYLSDSAFFEVLLLSSAELPAVFIGWLLIDRLGIIINELKKINHLVLGNCYLAISSSSRFIFIIIVIPYSQLFNFLLGRKKLALASYIIAAISSFLFNFCLPNIITRIIQFVMRGAIAIAFQCLYVLTPEIYPTSVRFVSNNLNFNNELSSIFKGCTSMLSELTLFMHII